MSWTLFIFGWAVRSSLLILTAGLLLRILRVREAAVKLAAWTGILIGSLAIPFLAAALPKVPLVITAKVSARTIATAQPIQTAAADILLSGDESPGSAPTSPSDWPRVATLAYGALTFVLLLRVAIGLALGLRLVRRSRRTEFAGLRESDEVTAPVTIGTLRPAILLPSDWREWAPLKLNAVLAHERSHIQRCDPAVQLLSAIHRSLLWANPLSWMLDLWIVRAAEEVSDDAAVAVTKDRVAYAEVLLGFITQAARQREQYGVAMARYGNPDKRIDRILDGTSVSGRITRATVAAIIVLAAPLAYLAAATTALKEQVIHFPTLPAPPSPPRNASEPIQLAQAQAPAPQPQPATPQKVPAFDAVSIKSLPPRAGGRSGDTKGPSSCPSLKYTTGMIYGAASVSKLIQEAYGLSQHQISGGADWIDSEGFCIEAKSAAPAEKPELALMLQSMLADRFHLVLRQETKEMPAYLMTVSKPGRLLEITPEQASQPCCSTQALQAMGYKTYHEPDGGPAGAMILRTTMQGYATFLSRDPGLITDRPVVDRTGLTGTYLLFVQFGANDNFLDAIGEQFGLKFEAAKAPLPAVVIESVERPSAN